MVALCQCGVVLEGSKLGLELLVEQPLLHGGCSHIRAPFVLAHDQTAGVVPSFAPSSRRGSERAGLRVAETVLAVRWSRCPQRAVDC